MILDLDKASAALTSLKSAEGMRALEGLHSTLQQFRSQLGQPLNDAEFRYVMQTLFNEQVVTVSPEVARAAGPPASLAHGFTIRNMI